MRNKKDYKNCTAFVLIQTRKGFEREVGEEILKLDNPLVENLHTLYGEYDLIAKIKTNGAIELESFVLNDIRRIEGVENTETLIVSDKE